MGPGALLGSLIAVPLVRRRDALSLGTIAWVAQALPLWILVFQRPLLLLVVALFASGSANGVRNPPTATLTILRVPPPLRPQSAAAASAAAMIGGLVALGLTGPALEVFGAPATFAAVASISSLGATLFVTAARRERKGMPVTQPQELSLEMVEVVDESNHTLDVVPRSIIRQQNLLHRTVAILCRNRAGEVYVHRRTDTKDVYPGAYDVCVGGVVAAGESNDQTALRELAEELGIEGIEPRFLFFHRYEGPRKRCLIGVYEVEWNGPIHHQETEVAWGGWMAPDELEKTLTTLDLMPDHLEVYRRIRLLEDASGPPGWD